MSGAAAGNGRQYAAPGIMLRTAGNMLLPLVLSLRDSICCCRLCCCCEIQHVAMLLLLLHYFLYRVEVEKRAILKNESGGKASLPKMPAYFHKSETRSAGHSRSRWHRLYIADFSR